MLEKLTGKLLTSSIINPLLTFLVNILRECLCKYGVMLTRKLNWFEKLSPTLRWFISNALLSICNYEERAKKCGKHLNGKWAKFRVSDSNLMSESRDRHSSISRNMRFSCLGSLLTFHFIFKSLEFYQFCFEVGVKRDWIFALETHCYQCIINHL